MRFLRTLQDIARLAGRTKRQRHRILLVALAPGPFHRLAVCGELGLIARDVRCAGRQLQRHLIVFTFRRRDLHRRVSRVDIDEFSAADAISGCDIHGDMERINLRLHHAIPRTVDTARRGTRRRRRNEHRQNQTAHRSSHKVTAASYWCRFCSQCVRSRRAYLIFQLVAWSRNSHPVT